MYNQSSNQRSTIPTVSALILVVIVAVLAFTAGLRAEEHGFLDDFTGQGQTNTANTTLPDDLDYTEVEELYDELRESFDGTLTVDKLLSGMKQGLVEASGDPYTEYLDAEQAKNFSDSLNGTFTGIGAELSKEDGNLVIVAPIKGFAAEKAGLRSRDVIIKIDDKDTAGLSVEEAVSLIRGEAGTKVTLTILRGDKQQVYTLKREEIKVPSVEWEVKDGSIGYISISRFADDTTALAKKAAQELKDKNVKGVVLDLRNNSGGLLDSAVDVSGIWLNNKVVVEQRTNKGKTVTSTLKSGNGAILDGVPTVILINGGSASASEIVAGALHDHKVATLVGETTYGKGSVQAIEQVGSGMLKVTIAHWYTPNGKNIESLGIAPDVKVTISEKDLSARRDPQLLRALKLATP